MPRAERFEDFGGRLRAPSFHVLITFHHCRNGFVMVSPFPCQCIGQNFIQRLCGVLPMTLSIVVELGFAFGREGNHLPAPNLGFSPCYVNFGMDFGGMEAFELQPRQPFRIIREQIDCSFALDGHA